MCLQIVLVKRRLSYTDKLMGLRGNMVLNMFLITFKQKAAELDPKDPGCQHFLGIW